MTSITLISVKMTIVGWLQRNDFKWLKSLIQVEKTAATPTDRKQLKPNDVNQNDTIQLKFINNKIKMALNQMISIALILVKMTNVG